LSWLQSNKISNVNSFIYTWEITRDKPNWPVDREEGGKCKHGSILTVGVTSSPYFLIDLVLHLETQHILGIKELQKEPTCKQIIKIIFYSIFYLFLINLLLNL
jgi:hypothetical protein